MIERLLEGGRRFGGSAYQTAAEEILRAEAELNGSLGAQGKELLEKLEAAYIRREGIVMAAAFREGFCTAALLALDVWAYRREAPDN